MHQLFSEIPQTQQCIPYDYFKTTHYIFPALILRFGQLLNCWTVGISGIVGVFYIYIYISHHYSCASQFWQMTQTWLTESIMEKKTKKNKQQRASTTAF